MIFERAKVRRLALGAALLAGVAWACGSNPQGSDYGTPGDGGGGSSSGSSSGFSSGACNPCGDATTPPTALYFMPPLATVVLDGTGSKTASFTLIATDSGGHTANVTADSVAFDRPDLATVTAAEPVVATAPSQTALYAGTGKIHAIYHGKEATAQPTVQGHIPDYRPGR